MVGKPRSRSSKGYSSPPNRRSLANRHEAVTHRTPRWIGPSHCRGSASRSSGRSARFGYRLGCGRRRLARGTLRHARSLLSVLPSRSARRSARCSPRPGRALHDNSAATMVLRGVDSPCEHSLGVGRLAVRPAPSKRSANSRLQRPAAATTLSGTVQGVLASGAAAAEPPSRWAASGRVERRRRVTIKVIGFVMGHMGWVILGVLASVGIIACRTSITLAVVLMVACWMAMTRFLHNSNPLTPWLRGQDDQITFRGCRDGVFAGPRRMYRWMPSDPRCRFCLVPFGGVGKLLGITPSRKNPDFCTDCIEGAPVGTYEKEVGVLFADIRGFTEWSEKRSPAEVVDRLTRFYALASRVLTRDDAFVEFIGDQVMALYLPDFPSLRQRTSEVMISAAMRLLSTIDRQQAEDV